MKSDHATTDFTKTCTKLGLTLRIVSTHSRQSHCVSGSLLCKAAKLVHLLIDGRVLLKIRRAVLQTLFLAIQQNLVIEARHACIEAAIHHKVVDLMGHLLVRCETKS